MTPPNRFNLPELPPALRPRSNGDNGSRADLTADPHAPLLPGRDPIRVVGRIARHRLSRARAYRDGWDAPGRATGLAKTSASLGHLVRVVLPRYLLTAVILAAAVWALTGALWLVYVAAGLPLLVFLWYGNHVRREARDYRQGRGGPPPGHFGKL